MSGTATKGEKFKAAFGFISKNVLVEKKKQVGKVLDDLDTAMEDLEETTRKTQETYHPGKKGVATQYESLRTRLNAVETNRTEKEAYKECEAIETQAKAALKSVPALIEAAKQQVEMNKKSKEDIDQIVKDLGSKVTTPEDQGKMIAAIKARFSIDELGGELTSNMLPALYKALSLVPDNHTIDNPMLKVIKRSKMSDTSLYYPGGSGTITINGGKTGPHSSEREKYTDGAGKKLEFSKFDAHTLHEVGHSVDDAAGFMAAKGSSDDFGGWGTSDWQGVSEAGVKRYAANKLNLIPAVLKLLTDTAVRGKGGTIEDVRKEMTKMKGALDALPFDDIGDDPAIVAGDALVAGFLDDFPLPLTGDSLKELNKRFDVNVVSAMTTQIGEKVEAVTKLLRMMKGQCKESGQLKGEQKQLTDALGDAKGLDKLYSEILTWANTLKSELWWKSTSEISGVAVDGTVYQKDEDKWVSYKLSARGKMVKDYQFRSPGEWFAEVYAVAMLGKLSDSHPCAAIIKQIDTTRKIGA